MSELDPLPGRAWQGPPPIPPPVTAVAVEDEPDRYPFWTWGDLLVFLAMILPCFIAASLMGLAVIHVAGLHDRRNAVLLASQFAGYGLAFVALWAMFRTRYRRPFWSSLAWRLDRWMIVPMFGAGMALAFAVVLLAALLRTKPVRTPMEELMSDPTTAAMVALFAVTIGPVCEELVFRGLMQPLLVRSLGTVPGIVAAALPFALLHGPQYSWSWQRVVLVATAGVAFGVVRQRTSSTALAAVTHAGYNLTFFVFYYVGQMM